VPFVNKLKKSPKCIEGGCQNQVALKIFGDLVTLFLGSYRLSMLTPAEKSGLLRIAREAIAQSFQQRKAQGGFPNGAGFRRPEKQLSWEGHLAEQCGAFVTIHLHGELRGCIGYIEAPMALGNVVQDVARKAAFEDPRFPPMSEEEFRSAELEISVLSPLRKVATPEEVVVGTHGAVIESGYMRGLLLPQVPVEYGWDRETFLDNLARKAGLPRNAWRDPKAEIFVFTAEVFGEG
jgi:AmmeMemoRadiSam system protein A